MFNTLTRATTLGALLMAAIFATSSPAFSQAPSQAQRDAIKSQCRSDYIAHCSSVPPGGEASLQCLQKNMSSLSSSCQSAVRAVEAPAARAGVRDPQRVPFRLSQGLRGRTDRRRAGAAMPGKEQGKAFARLRTGGRRRQRRWRSAAGGCRGSSSGRRACRSGGTGRAHCHRAAADAATRRIVRAAVGVRRRRAFDLRRRGARRRTDRAMPCDQRRLAVASVQGRAEPVRRAIDRAAGDPLLERGSPAIRREMRGSAQPAAPTSRYSKSTSRSGTRYAN